MSDAFSGFGGGGGLGGILSGLFTGSFGGGRQLGGPVNPRQSYLVGESGPELFRPNTAGEILDARSTRNLGSGSNTSISVNNYIQGGGDSEAERQALGEGTSLATINKLNEMVKDGRI